MEREGPCFHCGIKYTPLWRSGPPEKAVLCNACGTRWRIRGSLEDYIPKQVISGKYSACTEDDAKNRSRSGSSRNCIKMGSINGSHKSTAPNPPVPKRKRSAPKQRILSPIQRFQWQLYCLSQEPEFSKLREEQEDVLIYHKPSSQMPTEIGLGAVLLKPPPSTNN